MSRRRIREWCCTSIAQQLLYEYKNAIVRTDISVILLYHAHAIKQADCIPWYRVRETSPTSLISQYPLEKTNVRFFLGCMYSVEKTAPVPSKGRGKVGPLKKLEKHPRCHKAFRQHGEEWNPKYHVLKQLEEFTCLMYGQNRESSMNGLRAKLLRKVVGEDEKLTSKSKIDLVRLPPSATLF